MQKGEPMFRLKLPDILRQQLDKGNIDPEVAAARIIMQKEVDVVRVAEDLLETVRRPFDLAKGCIRENGLYFESKEAVDRYREVLQEERKVVSEAESRALFEYLSQQEHIPFHYPQEGCFARAHEMSELLELKGIASRKVFIIDSDNDLSVASEWSPTGKVTWNYHVATLVTVRGKDGAERDLVFDPSIMTAPATVSEWQAKMSKATCKRVEKAIRVSESQGKGCVYYVTSRYAYTPSSAQDEPQTKWRAADIDDANETMSLYLPIARKREAAKRAASH